MKRTLAGIGIALLLVGAILAGSAMARPACCGGLGFGAATCTGSRTCTACKNCKYCKHCNAGGGTCGVCKPR